MDSVLMDIAYLVIPFCETTHKKPQRNVSKYFPRSVNKIPIRLTFVRNTKSL